MAQFEHWTKETFSANFRKMLTLEQYCDPKLVQLHHDYLAGGPLKYMAVIFRKLADSDETAMQLALEFYEPMYLLYIVYDGAEDKESIAPLLDTHIPVLSRQRQRASAMQTIRRRTIFSSKS